jgi:RNA polymerase sigma-70 factor (sigma-E family)
MRQRADRAWEIDYVGYVTGAAGRLRRVAYALCGDWHQADDLVQATFLRLYLNWRRVRGETVDAYARRILLNRYLSGRRRSRREDVVADPPDLPAPATGAGGEARLDFRLDLATALAALPPQRRAMIVLRYPEELWVAEVADLLGVAEGTVKSQTARTLQGLRVALGEPARDK